jgi:Skp family chaperone for outer membrane proteins
MRTFRLIAVSVVFAAIFAVSALAQTTPTTTTSNGKIGLMDTRAFGDEKEGIKKYIAAMTTLAAEFKPVETELQALATKIQALEKEIQGYREILDKGGKIPIDNATLSKKVEEFEKMVREFKFKEEGAKSSYARREQVVMGPILQDIGAAIQEFTKKNGYVLIIDVSRDNTGIILGMDQTADVTKSFIAFYNARPATTATVTRP